MALELAQTFQAQGHLAIGTGNAATVITARLSVPALLAELDFGPQPGICELAVSGSLGAALPSTAPPDSAVVISLGSIREHQVAREEQFRAGSIRRRHLCIPGDLRNDGFLTDRYRPRSAPTGAAAQVGAYPALIVLDLEHIGASGVGLQAAGVGEAIGLSVSFQDQLLLATGRVDTEVQVRLWSFVDDLVSTWSTGSLDRLGCLAVGLLVKGLTMRLCGTNHVGAAADHMISYELERQGLGGESHGARVLLGSIIADLCLANRCLGVPRVARLIEFGLAHRYWTWADLAVVGDLDWGHLVAHALATRPARPTSLRQVTRTAAAAARQRYGVIIA